MYYLDVLKSLKFGQSATGTQSVHGMATLKHEYKLKFFWALTRSSRPAVVVEYPAIPDSKVAQCVGGSDASHFRHWHTYRECCTHALSD